MASVRSLSSRWVAWASAVAYLVVSTVVGAVLLTMPKAEVTDNPATYMSGGTGPGITTSAAPPGFQWIDGPEGMQTVIPDSWQTVAAGGPGAMRAVDPSNPERIVGFGGAKASSTDIVRVHVAYEKRFADLTTAYQRVGLNSASYGGHPAVEWEFTHRDARGLQRVHALYWLVDGTEYFVLASAPDTQWSRMKPVYDAMVANSRP